METTQKHFGTLQVSKQAMTEFSGAVVEGRKDGAWREGAPDLL